MKEEGSSGNLTTYEKERNLNRQVMTHSSCFIHHRLPLGAGAGALANATFAGVISTLVSLSGACEGYSQGLDFLLVLLATSTEGPLPPSSVLGLFSSFKGPVVSKASREQCAQRPVQGRQRQVFTQVCLRNTPSLEESSTGQL